MDLFLEENTKSLSHFFGCSFQISNIDIITFGIINISDQ